MYRKRSVDTMIVVAAFSLSVSLLSAAQSNASSRDGVAGPRSQAFGLNAPGSVFDELPGDVVAATATTRTVREADGSFRLESFAAPVNYVDGTGSWDEVDTSWVSSEEAGVALETEATEFEAQLPSDGSDPIRYEIGEHWIESTLNGMNGSPVTDGEVAVFEDVAGAASVEYTATATGLKENIVLTQRPQSPHDFEFELRLSPGLAPTVDEDGGITFSDDHGVTAATVPPGVMADSATAPVISNDVSYALTRRTEDSWTLTVRPDFAWLTAVGREYPVRIDPTLTSYGSNRDCWIRSSTPNESYCGPASSYLKVGRDGSGADYRGLVDFSVAPIPPTAQILDASIKLYLDATQTPTNMTTDYAFFRPDRNFNMAATWNSSGAAGAWVGGNPLAGAYGTQTLTGTTNSGYRTFTSPNMSDLVRGWVSGSIVQRGLVLKQHNGNVNNMLHFISADGATTSTRPTLVVNYSVPNAPPSSPSIQATPCLADCSGVEVGVDSLTPTFTVASTDDQTSGVLSYAIAIQYTGGPVVASASRSAAQGAAVTWTVPSGLLHDQDDLQLKVVVTDAWGSSTTALRALGVQDGLDPSAPVVLDEFGLTAVARHQMEAIAATTGRTLTQTVADHSWSDAFSQKVEAIRTAFPSFAHAEMDPESAGAPATISFKGSVPSDVHQLVANLPVAVALRDDAPLTETESVKIIDDTSASILARVGDNVDLTTTYDWDLAKPVAIVSGQDGTQTKQQVQSSVSSEVANQNPSLTFIGADVSLLAAEDGPAAGPEVRGGERISVNSDGSNFCTSGWPVREGAGPTYTSVGVATARHCPENVNWISGNSARRRKNLGNTKVYTPEAIGDIQYHPAINGERSSPYFYWKKNVAAPIWGINRPTRGMYVCLFGRATGGSKNGKSTCSKVRDLNVSVHYDDGDFDFKRLIGVEEHVSTGGDSGGPWYDRNFAVGIHSGFHTYGPFWNRKKGSLFTEMSKLGYFNPSISLHVAN